MSHLWKKVSEKEKVQVKKDAKRILDSFSRKLGKVADKLEEPLIERETLERSERDEKCDGSFSREIFFENAPKKNKDFIIAEKKKW